MHRADHRAHLGTEASDQRRRTPFEHDDFVAELDGRRGDLEADEPGADHHDALAAAGQSRPHGECVVERAQHVDVLVGAVVADVLRCGTGGDDHPVEFEGPTVGQHQRAFGQVEPLPATPSSHRTSSSSNASGWRRWIRSASHSPDSSFFDSGGRS